MKDRKGEEQDEVWGPTLNAQYRSDHLSASSADCPGVKVIY